MNKIQGLAFCTPLKAVPGSTVANSWLQLDVIINWFNSRVEQRSEIMVNNLKKKGELLIPNSFITFNINTEILTQSIKQIIQQNAFFIKNIWIIIMCRKNYEGILISADPIFVLLNSPVLLKFGKTSVVVLLSPVLLVLRLGLSPSWFPFSPQRFPLSFGIMGWEVWKKNQSITCHDWNEGKMWCGRYVLFESFPE